MKVNMRDQDGRLTRGGMTRRTFVVSVAAASLAPHQLFAADPVATPIAARTLNLIAFRVSDVQRTVDWYQKIFGLPVRFTQDVDGGKAVFLAIGKGSQSVALFPANGTPPGYSHMGFGVPNFDRALHVKMLNAHAVKTDPRNRKTSSGDVEELFFRDADDLLVQLQDVSYCGGAGPLGGTCPQPWKMPVKGGPPPLAARTLNHVSFQVADIDRAVHFYMRVFDMWLQTVQPMTKEAPVPILGIGNGPELIAPYGGNGAKPGIGHCCLGLEKFDYDKVAKALEAHGIKATGRVRPSKPPYDVREGYMLRDPDNLAVQVADMTYCGGRGAMGQLCP